MSEPIDLYALLPGVYRHEDAGLGVPLETMLGLVSAQASALLRDVTDLWDDFFVETAAEWALPYLADLIGATPLHEVAGSRRADLARTIGYRRRKGTLEMLEAMAADVTGWGVRVTPYFELLEWTQHLDHLRRAPYPPVLGRVGRVGTADLADLDALDRLDGPFDTIAHSVDIRPFTARRSGRPAIRAIGFHLWRLQSNPLVGVDPRPAAGVAHGFHLSPLGNPMVLFTNDERPDAALRPAEADLPGPIRRLALRDDLAAAAVAQPPASTSRYYGPLSHHSLAVAVGDPATEQTADLIPAAQVAVCDLTGWRRPPAGRTVAVDPVLGRITFAAGAEPGPGQRLRANVGYGFSGAAGADLGGGPYDRRGRMRPAGPRDVHVVVARVPPATLPAGGPAWRDTVTAGIAAALGAWTPAADRAVVEICDSATYAEGALTVVLPDSCELQIQAANGQRPVLEVTDLTVSSGGGGALGLDGVAVLGAGVRVGSGVSRLTVADCTLVPGLGFTPAGEPSAPSAPSISTTASGTCHVTLRASISGPIRLPTEAFTVSVGDAVLDAPDGGPALAGPGAAVGPTCDLARVTVFGGVRVRTLRYASDVLFVGPVSAERTQEGCVRFSSLPDVAVTPARYRCQPDLALAELTSPVDRSRARRRVHPRFTSRRYGRPGYAQLADRTAEEVRAGGSNRSEMGAFNALLHGAREANLRLRLAEYLPAGLEPGLIHIT